MQTSIYYCLASLRREVMRNRSKFNRRMWQRSALDLGDLV